MKNILDGAASKNRESRVCRKSANRYSPQFNACSVIALAAGSALLTQISPAWAQGPSYDVSCRNGDEIRQILIVSPGERGLACDVIYTKDRGQTVTTPFYANSEVGFCRDKAVEIKERLESASYQCSGVGIRLKASLREPVAEAAPTPQNRLNTSENAPSQKVTASTQESAPLEDIPVANANEALSAREAFLERLKKGSPQSLVVPAENTADLPLNNSQEEVIPQKTVTAAAIIPAPAPSLLEAQKAKPGQVAVDSIVNSQGSVPLAEVGPQLPQAANEEQLLVPAQIDSPFKFPEATIANAGNANSGPVSLVSDNAQTNTVAPNLSATGQTYRLSRADVADKLVGATPVVLPSQASDSNIVAPIASVPATTITPVATNQASGAAQKANEGAGITDLFSSVLPNVQDDKPLTRPDIIRATLTAQAAAWNEGDIEAFMEGYWRDPDLRFVSGTDVSKGWNNTLKRYKSRYGNGEALGQLQFSEMDVQMVTQDVAIVVGRFNLARAQENNSGLYTLVMKRFEGAWRIVHDHTVADPVVETTADPEN